MTKVESFALLSFPPKLRCTLEHIWVINMMSDQTHNITDEVRCELYYMHQGLVHMKTTHLFYNATGERMRCRRLLPEVEDQADKSPHFCRRQRI